MLWPMTAVALGFLGIAVLGTLAVRVALEVRHLARQVGETSQQITRVAADLEESAAAVARQAGGAVPSQHSRRR